MPQNLPLPKTNIDPTEPLKKLPTSPTVMNGLKELPKGDLKPFTGREAGQEYKLDISKYTDYIPTVYPDQDIEEFRAQAQSTGEKWLYAVPRLVSKVGTEVLKTPGYLYAGLAAMGDQTLAQTLDNAWLNNLDSVNEAVKEQFAIYKPKAVREGNLWDNITSASFYTDEGIDGAGFLISMMAPGMALKGLNVAGKVAKLGAASKLAGAFGTTSKAIGAGVELGAATTINTALEAMAEAKGISDELNNTLQGQINPNTGFQYTQEEIDALRGEAAVGTFRTNLGILLIPNLIMNKMLLGRYTGTKSAFNSVVSETGELIAQNPAAKQSLLKAYLKNIGKGVISEGFFEEGLQDATTNYYKDKVTGKTDADWLSGIIDAYGDTIGSTEGQKAIFLGGLLGGGMSVIGTRRELKGEQEYKNSLVKMLQNNFTGFANAQDIFEKDENGNIKVETNPETGEIKPVYNMEKATEFLKMTTDAIEKSNKQDLAAFLGDKDEYDRQYLENFIAYAMPYLNVENGIEAVNRQIDNMSKEVIDKTKQTSDMFDSTFDETQFKEDLKQKVKEVAKQQVGIQNQMDTVYNTIPKDNPELAKAFVNQLGNAATIEVTNQIFYNSKIRELNNEISQMETSINANLPQNQAIINNLVKKRDEYQKSLDESIKNYSEIFDKNKVLGAFEEYKTIKDKLKDIINKIQSGEVTDLNELTKTDEQKHEEALDKFYKAQDINELNDAVEALKQSPLLTEELANKLNEEYDKAVESFARKDQIDQIINRKEEVYNSLTDQIKQARESIEEKEVEAEILQEDYASGKLKISEKNLAKKINEINDAIKQLEDFIANAEAQRDQILAEVDYYGTEAAMDMEAVEANRDAKRRTIEDINKRIEETKTLLDRLKDLLKGMTAVWNKVFPNKKVNLEKGRWEYIDAKSQIDAKKSEITEVNNLLAELEDIKAELIKQEEALTSELEEFKQITSKYYKGREAVDTTIDETTNNPDDVEIDEQPKAFDPKSIKSINIAFGSTAGNNMIGETDKVTNDPDQLRWFRYTSQLKFNKNLSAYNLMAVTSKNNPYGDKVKFKDTEKGEDIVLILHKDGQPVVVDGELVYTSMWGNWTLEQAKTRFSNPSKMSDADMQRLLDNHKKLRESIIAGTKPTMLPATGLTPGIRVIDNTKDTEGKFIYKFPVSGRIVDSNDQIDTIEMEVATTNTVTVGNYQVDAVPGMVYVKVNGQVVPMRIAKIGEIDGAVEKIVKLITQLRDVTSPKFTGDRTQEFKRIYDEINKVILFANTKEDSKYKIFMAKDGRLYYNGKYHTAINLEDLQNFLANKYFRVSNKLLKANQKSFKDPISGKTWPSYKHYLMSNEGRADNQVPVGTDLVGNTNQQFLNVGISYLSRPETTKKTNEFGSGLAVEISPRKTTTVDDEEFGPIPGEGLQRLPSEISPRATAQKPTGPIAPGTKFTKSGSEITITKSDQYKVEFTTSTGAKQSMRLNDFNAAIQKGSIKAIGAPIGTGLAAEVSPRAKVGVTPTVTEGRKEVPISAPVIEDTKPTTKSRVLFTQEHDEAIKEAEAIEDQITQESASTQSLVDKLNSLQSDDTGEDFPGLEREHYRLFISEEAATQAELDAEEKWFRSNFPEIDYTRVKNLIDGKAVGKFLGSGRILISQLAAKGTTYHEAFHVVSQLFFTEKERQALYKEYSNRTGKELTDDQAEEGLAEDFRAYMIGERLSFSPKQKSLFRRLLDAIKSLLGIGQPNIEEIFEKIKSGAYKSSKPLVDKNNGAKNYYSEVPGKDTQWTRDFMESTTVFFFKHLMKGNQDWSIENLFDTSNKAFIGNIYERVKNDFIETYKKLPKEYQEALAQDYNFILAPTLSQNEQNKRWNILVKAHAKYLSKFGMEIKFRDNIDEIDPDSNTTGQRDDYEDNIPESERTTKDNTYIDAINFSTKDKMPKSVKLLIASLPKVETREGKPKVIVNRFGTPAGVDFNRTMDWLHNKLANISDLNDMIKTINELSDIKPELKVLLGYLKIDTSNNLPITLDFDQAKLVVQFWQQFAKTKNTYYTGLIDDAGNFIFADSNSQRFKSKIQSQWANAMKDSANTADGIYTINSDGRIVFNTAKLQKISLFTNTNNIDSVIKFFNELGITFSTDKWNKITDYRQWEEDNKVKGVFKPFSKETADEVGIILNAYAKIKEFVLKNDNIESLFDKGLIRGSMDALAELEGKYNPTITESQHLSPDKKTVYDITLNTFLSNVVNKINRYGIESIDHLNRKNNIYTRGSLFYDLLLAGKKLDLVVLSGMRINEPGEEGELTSDLKAGDFYVQSMNAILGNNIQFIRAADKKLEYAFHIDFDLTNEEFEEQMIRYFYDDIVRSIELVQNGVGADIANYKNNAKRSVLFEGIFKDNAKLVYDASKLKNADAFIRKNREAIVNAIRSWSNEQIKKQTDVFIARNIIVAKGDKFMIKGIDNTLLTKMFGEDIDTTVDTFTAEEINSIIRNIHNKFTIGAIEQIKLFTGDLAFFKDGSDVSKRTGGLTGPKKLSLIGSAINTFLNTNMKRKDGKQANDKFNVLVYSDVKTVSENLDEYKAAIGYKADKYASYDEADAQGLITLDEYREMMFRAGDWTPQQNEAYKKLINGETLTTDELALFPPTKPQYYGPRTDNNGKLYIPTYYKLSLMPLIPQALKGTQLEKLNKYMTDNKIGITMFASANKVGNNTNPSFYKEDGTINLPGKTELANYLQESEYAYMGIQVDNAPIEKTKVTLGTQFRALILSNLFNNGVGKVISFFNHNTGKVESKDTREIADEYNSIVNEITDIEWNNLLNRLTLTKDNSGNYKISDIEVFKDILISEAEDRAAAYNIIDYIYKSLEGDVRAVDFTLSKGKIENLLYSMVNNKVVKQKVNGDMKVLAASTGFELQARKFKDLPDGTKKILGNDVLKFYTQKGPNGTTTKMQVLLPWYFKEMFKGADLKNIDPKILNLVGVRTPTEGYKNIEAIEVAGFLPREVGNLVVTPSEIVVKSGSDYDVDKLTLYIPNSIKIGNKYKYIPTDEKGLKKLYDEWVKNYQDKLKLVKQRIKDIETKPLLVEDKDITDFRELLASAFSDIAESEKLLQSLINKEKNIESQLDISFDDFKNNLRRKQLENKMIELSLNVLSSPDIFGQLITPTSVDTFETLAKKISKTLGTEDSKYTTSIIQFLDNAITAQRFWTGKSGVGIIALHNKSHTLAQQANLSMPDATLYFGKNGKPLYNTTDGTPTGDISLASEYDANGETSGNRISDMLAELLNSYLEVAKNPFILKLNAGVNTANVWAFLLRSGVPIDTLAAFMNQPIIRSYTFEQSVNEAMFKKATQDKLSPVLSKDQLIQKIKLQYQANKVKVRDEASYELMDDAKLNSMLGKDIKRDNNFYINQLQILDNFLKYQEYSKNLSELQKYTSVDTNGAGKNRNEARASIKGLNTLKVMNTFNGIDEYINNTILKGFYNAVNESQSMYNELFVTDLPKSQEALSNINDYIDNLGFTSDTAAELKNLAENEFISYLLQTVKSDNKFLSQEITRLFNGKNSIANKLLEIKRNKKHPLNNNTVIKELFPVLRGNNMTDIIKRFNRQMNTYEQNIFVDAFKEIYETNPALAMDIVKFGIIQSGLNNSPITFNSLIPADLFFRVADPILLQYITSENIDVNTFSTQFLLNNYTGAAAKLVRRVRATDSKGLRIPLVKKNGSPNFIAKYNVLKTVRNLAKKNETPVWETKLYVKTGGDETTAYYSEAPLLLLGEGMNIHRYYPSDVFNQIIAHNNPTVTSEKPVVINESDEEYEAMESEETPEIFKVQQPTVSPRTQAPKLQAPVTPGKLKQEISPRAKVVSTQAGKQEYRLLPDKIKANLAKAGITEKMFNGLSNQEQQQALKCHG